MIKMSAHLTDPVDRNTGHIRTAPDGELAVAVLADDPGMDTSGIDIQMLPQQIAQASRIQQSPGPDDPLFRHAGGLDRHVRQDVNGIGHNKQDAGAVAFFDLGHDRPENSHIFLDQVQARLPRFLACSRSNNNNGRINDIVVGAGVNIHRMRKGYAMGNIQGFAFRPVLIRIDQHHFGKQTALHQSKSAGGSHEPAADDRNFS